ncbi:hypothetical protein [Celeribacter sp. ULVN23_4]
MAATLKFNAASTANASESGYVSVTIDGTPDGKEIDLLCHPREQETQAEFAQRIKQASVDLFSDIQTVPDDASYARLNADLTTESDTSEDPITKANSTSAAQMDMLLKRLAVKKYDCKLAPGQS